MKPVISFPRGSNLWRINGRAYVVKNPRGKSDFIRVVFALILLYSLIK